MRDRFLRFTTLITSITRNIRRLTTEAVARYDIKRSYVSALYFLYKNGPLSATKLCNLCGEDKANVSRTLHALEEDGYVVREERQSSRSRVRMMLTEEGMEIGAFLAGRISEEVERATRGIPPADIAVMYSVLERLDENMTVTESELD